MRKSPVGSPAIWGAKAFMYNYLTYCKGAPQILQSVNNEQPIALTSPISRGEIAVAPSPSQASALLSVDSVHVLYFS